MIAPTAGPLEGVRVVDLTTTVLGPMATCVLGDMGADVIKVEKPAGDGVRDIGPHRNPGMGAFFMNINRNKRSLVLDLKSPKAVEALWRLVENADVFVHNMRQKAVDRLGFSYAAVTKRNARIIYAAGRGYRIDGPRGDLPAYDDMIQGGSGVADLNRGKDGQPRYIPMPFVDKLVGYVLASAISMALYQREKTGCGQEVYVPMFETMLAFNLIEHLWGETFVPPLGPMRYPRMMTPHRRPFPTQDGYICMLAHTDDQWKRVFKAIDRPDLCTDERFAKINARNRNIDACYAILGEQFAQRPTAEWLQRLAAADIACGVMNELEDLLKDPYIEETGFFQQIEHPSEGTLRQLSIPLQFPHNPPRIRRPAPLLGEHTREILTELGYMEKDIADFGTPAKDAAG